MTVEVRIERVLHVEGRGQRLRLRGEIARAVARAGGIEAQFGSIFVLTHFGRGKTRVGRDQAGCHDRAMRIDDARAGRHVTSRADGDDLSVADDDGARLDFTRRADGMDVSADNGDGFRRSGCGEGGQ